MVGHSAATGGGVVGNAAENVASAMQRVKTNGAQDFNLEQLNTILNVRRAHPTPLPHTDTRARAHHSKETPCIQA